MGVVMIKEVIVVEGRNDERAVKAACNADTIATHGFGINKEILSRIKLANETRGIIILTDPDHAGEKIRERLTKLFPDAKHAWVPRIEATSSGDIGIENADKIAICEALEKAKVAHVQEYKEFDERDLMKNGLAGTDSAAARRDAIGRTLGIGYGNGRCFIKRMNLYGITREAFEEAVRGLEK